jgi:hypothetical protein
VGGIVSVTGKRREKLSEDLIKILKNNEFPK